MKMLHNVKLTVVFDNMPFAPHGETAWGFACIIESNTGKVLFDTGSNGKILLSNMRTFNIDVTKIKNVILSHAHWDHVDGLPALLAINPNINLYAPASLSPEIVRNLTSQGAHILGVSEPHELMPGIFSLGELHNDRIPEQSIVVNTEKGLVLLTGCAHPGIVTIVDQARKIFPGEAIYLAMGGFHLKNDSDAGVKIIAQKLKQYDVQYIAPSHCTGEAAIRILKEAYDNRFVESGLGNFITI